MMKMRETLIGTGIILALICGAGLYIGSSINTVAIISSAFATLVMAFFVGYSIDRGSEQHKETLREMQESRKAILKPIVVMEHVKGSKNRHTLKVKNVGLGPAVDVNVRYNCNKLINGSLHLGKMQLRTKFMAFKLPPLGSNEEKPVGKPLERNPPGYIYIELKWKDVDKNIKTGYYKSNLRDGTIEEIDKEEWGYKEQ